MKKITILMITVFLLITLCGCKIEETTILDDCILDESCNYEAVAASINPDEVMFNMVKKYSLENDINLSTDNLVMIVKRDLTKLELIINYYQVLYDISNEDFCVVKNMLAELYNYTESNLNPVESILLEVGNLQNNNYIMSYSPEYTELRVSNYIDSDYNGDLSLFYNQITNIIMSFDFDEFSIAFIYNDNITILINYSLESMNSIHLVFLEYGSVYPSELDKQALLTELEELLPNINIELS